MQKIIPEPLAQRPNGQSDIWNKPVSFDPGKYYHISAPSGTGKTTLGHIMYGLRNDYTGSLTIDDMPVSDFNIEHWCRIRQQELAIVFQDLRLFPALTAMENIELKANLTKSAGRSVIEQMAGKLGISELLSQTCNTLSQGEKQRVAIIRALCQPFSFIILDEPFSHLDEENIQNAIDLISETCKKLEAGIIILQLGDDALFPYHHKLIL